MSDPHILNWYDVYAEKIAGVLAQEFDVTLNVDEQKRISEAMYRAVNDSIVREQRS